MTLGYWSPLPPAPTGVADYSSALLPFLRQHGHVQINVRGDVNLYHIGNNGLHAEIYRMAIQNPGIVVLHDAVLHHFFLGMLDRDEYIREFIYNYGEQSRQEAEDLWRQRSLSGADPRYFARPMIKRIASTALAVIVHNPAASRMVREHAPAARIVEVPHLFVAPPLPGASEVGELRRHLGLDPGKLLIGTFGHQRETKRLHVVLRAFERVRANALLLVSGEFVSKQFSKSIELLMDSPGIRRTGYLPPAEFWKYLAATDLCVNLRYPSAGESSGIAIQTMGIGKTVAMTNDDTIARFPSDACLRVNVGPSEEEELAGYISWLASKNAASMIGENAARYIAREHAPERAASAYWDVINKT